MKQNQSFAAVWTALMGALQAANNLVPGIVVVASLLSAGIIWICLTSTTLMIGFALLLVFVVSIFVLASTSNYGEAALSLVAGLLTVFSVEWTSSRFIAFSAIWVAFSLFALILSSIRLASKTESIYTHAAISLSANPHEIKEARRRLQEIGKKGTPLGQLGPVLRAEAIRLLVFRKIPIELISDALSGIEIFAAVTRVDGQTVTLFMADLIKILESQSLSKYQEILDQVLTTMRTSAVSPEDFIRAFQCSRRLILSGTISPEVYFHDLKENLEAGVAPEAMLEVLQAHHDHT